LLLPAARSAWTATNAVAARSVGNGTIDRLLFHPAVASLDQVDRLADAVR
jgi:hypothetical protein